jgi:hypothetical protein
MFIKKLKYNYIIYYNMVKKLIIKKSPERKEIDKKIKLLLTKDIYLDLTNDLKKDEGLIINWLIDLDLEYNYSELYKILFNTRFLIDDKLIKKASDRILEIEEYRNYLQTIINRYPDTKKIIRILFNYQKEEFLKNEELIKKCYLIYN